jgi:small subunit ribosomal protein S7
MGMKLFDKYDVDAIAITDPALKPYLNVEARILPKSHGRNVGKFGAGKIPLIERFANRIAVPGHVGKKHKIITSWSSGKYNRNMSTMLTVLTIIEEKKKTNPIQILIKAIENGAPRDETTTIEYGGARYPQAVDVSPTRRINLTIRWLVQGAYQRCFGKKKKMAESLAQEIMLTADGNMESFVLAKKNDVEKQADSAR